MSGRERERGGRGAAPDAERREGQGEGVTAGEDTDNSASPDGEVEGSSQDVKQMCAERRERRFARQADSRLITGGAEMDANTG